MDYKSLSLKKHKQYKGKLAVASKVPLKSKEDLSTYYTPGVAAPCLEIEKNPGSAYDYTRKNNAIAVVSDGSAVLWLGNIGWLAGLPVMEGKAILFKSFWNVDAVPLVLKTQNPDEIINIVENIAPSFGGINLEDIKAPECFYIEEELKKRLDIPVFHDDQHGTAIVTLAWIINALKLTNKTIEKCKIAISGAGSAGIAIAKLLIAYGASNIVMTDSKGIINNQRKDLNKYKASIANYNLENQTGDIHDAIKKADIFIWVSKPNIIDHKDVQNMNDKPTIFAMSNPDPEILPLEAEKWWVYIMATGRSDFPNQINNVLAFPWLFRGALDQKIKQFTQDHFIAAAKAIANSVQPITPQNIIPSPFQEWLAQAVASSLKNF